MPSFKTENALLLSAKPLGERSWLLSVLTPENGRFCGVLKTKQPPHVGSFLSLRWQARLNEQLGTFYLDDAKAFFIDFLDDKIRLYILSSVCVLLTELLPERQKEDDLYEQTIHLLQNMAQSDILLQYIKWELALLRAIGFGLDFSECAGGGDKNDLAYISPKSGRAVSREKGLPYQDKLLPLPRFLWQKTNDPSNLELIQAFSLTTYFLTTYTGLKQLPVMREQLIHLLLK